MGDFKKYEWVGIKSYPNNSIIDQNLENIKNINSEYLNNLQKYEEKINTTLKNLNSTFESFTKESNNYRITNPDLKDINISNTDIPELIKVFVYKIEFEP